MELVSALKKDHLTLKKLYNAGLKKNATLDEKRKIFKKLSVLVPAHALSEEQALYSNTTNLGKVEHFAFEGYEEHHIVDKLLRELKSEGNEHIWAAKFTVVCELLQHHIEEEEKEYFPKVVKMLSLETRRDLGKEYQNLFAGFAKTPQREPQSKFIPTHAAH